ncbi:hypothetical protein MN116_005181 [Schistosoma mekongi]|uniref:Uncharacterized protein n=1 Tax=Schistosoma mekongi TaxID=38744 RepID=A0AAE1ZDH4_SCHME|nr:hypothetical protein MN116_005181 [Schistosoma mekongi]
MGSVLLEGHIVNSDQCSVNTLALFDEPIRDTIVKIIVYLMFLLAQCDKRSLSEFYVVSFGRRSHMICLNPKYETNLSDFELFMPFFISRLLHSSPNRESSGHGGPEFAQVFVIFWLGSAIVTINSKLLGGAV